MERSCAQHFVTQPNVCNFVLSYKDSTDQFHITENETLKAGSRHSTVETAVCPRVPYAWPCFDYSSLPSLEWGLSTFARYYSGESTLFASRTRLRTYQPHTLRQSQHRPLCMFYCLQLIWQKGLHLSHRRAP